MYSSANMIFMTRCVELESAGSGWAACPGQVKIVDPENHQRAVERQRTKGVLALGIGEGTKLVELRQTFGKVDERFPAEHSNLVGENDIASE